MTNEELIEELLIEADSRGVRDLVLRKAAKLRQLDPRLTPVRSYEEAYYQVIKDVELLKELSNDNEGTSDAQAD